MLLSYAARNLCKVRFDVQLAGLQPTSKLLQDVQGLQSRKIGRGNAGLHIVQITHSAKGSYYILFYERHGESNLIKGPSSKFHLLERWSKNHLVLEVSSFDKCESSLQRLLSQVLQDIEASSLLKSLPHRSTQAA